VKRTNNTRRKAGGNEAAYARERREEQCAKDARWVDVDRAMEIAVETGVEDGADHLRVALKQGLLCRFQHHDRYWVSKPTEEVALLLAGRNPIDLEDKYWKLVIHEVFWREYLDRYTKGPAPAEPPPKKRARATKRATIAEYIAFQNTHLAEHDTYASKSDEEAWAKTKGCSARHVRDVLRPKYRDGLPPAEQAHFQSRSKKSRSA
jgi:hypothetical protein